MWDCKTFLLRLLNIFLLLQVYFCYSTYPIHDEPVWLVVSDSSQAPGLKPTRLLCPWNFSGKNTGMGCHFLLQGILPTQGSNMHLLRADSLPVSYLGSPTACAPLQTLEVLRNGRELGLKNTQFPTARGSEWVFWGESCNVFDWVHSFM